MQLVPAIKGSRYDPSVRSSVAGLHQAGMAGKHIPQESAGPTEWMGYLRLTMKITSNFLLHTVRAGCIFTDINLLCHARAKEQGSLIIIPMCLDFLNYYILLNKIKEEAEKIKEMAFQGHQEGLAGKSWMPNLMMTRSDLQSHLTPERCPLIMSTRTRAHTHTHTHTHTHRARQRQRQRETDRETERDRQRDRDRDREQEMLSRHSPV